MFAVNAASLVDKQKQGRDPHVAGEHQEMAISKEGHAKIGSVLASDEFRNPSARSSVRASDTADMAPVLSLGFLAAFVPTVLLLSARSSIQFSWPGPTAHAVLCLSTAVITAMVADRLAKEARTSSHPAVAILSVGYTGLAVIMTAQAYTIQPYHLAMITSLVLIWMVLCGGCAVVVITAAGARRWTRSLLTKRPALFYAALVMGFALLWLLGWMLDRPVFHVEERVRIVRTLTVMITAGVLPALLVSAFLVYLRKRNPVILFFNLGLYLYALGVLGMTAAPQWSLPWWWGEGLFLVSGFSIAYGILEANRVRDRLELIRVLAVRSQELQKSHSKLAHSELRYRSLVNNAPYGVFRLNHLERFEAINPALLDALGYGPMHSCSWLPAFGDLFHTKEEYSATIQELRRSGRVRSEVFWKRVDGSAFKIRLQCRRVPGATNDAPWFEGIVEDLTEQSSLEEQLRQSQKMEAIGRLAGGIAHDFNNLLTIINGYTGMLIDTFSENDPRLADAQRVKHAAQQAASLTRQLLAFSRKQVLSPTTLNLNTVVSDLSKILPRLLGEDVDLAFIPSDRLAYVCADRGQVEQVLMNLVVNARDAMPEGGKITIETSNETLDEKYTRPRGVASGHYVMLAVTDTGCGMDAATKARIFEPFFTTKDEGKGTGLGLATAYGIVRQSGGHIAVYSEPNLGTTFKVYFPVAAASSVQEKEVTTSSNRASGETVLVVEDDHTVRDMIVQALERRGYKVVQATSGEEALEMVAVRHCRAQLLITDIVMPGIRGTEVAQKLLSMIPNLAVLFMSGYTDNSMFHQRVLDTGACFIQKPFTLDVLDEKVAQSFDARSRLGNDCVNV